MRHLLLLVAIQLVFSSLKSQVTGLVKDEQGIPVKGATISLLRSADSGLVKFAASSTDGSFNFSGIKEGAYRLKTTFVGHKPNFSPLINYTGTEIKVPTVVMNKLAGDMKEVVVTASRPIIEVKADKTILNVEGTINSVGSDVVELLRKSPGVMVDKDDNISMNGKSGVQVFIDGRPTPLSGADLASYLKSIQSSQVESIELITNPSAKYEAAGNAGIINIKLKKNKSLGTNGSVNAGWNIGTYAKYNGGFSLNYRNKKVNLFGNYSYNQGINTTHLSLYRTVLDSLFDQNGTLINKNKTHNFKAGMDYFIDKKSTVGVILTGNFADPNFSNHSETPISYIPSGEVDRILVSDNTNAMSRDNLNLNLNYTYINPNGKNLTMNLDKGYYDLYSDQHQPNNYYDPSGQLISSVVYRMVAPTNIDINSLKLDYEQNFKKGKLGYGGKIGYVTSDNNFQRYNVYSTGEELDKDRSNRFEYKENINAAYVNYNRPFKGVIVQAGLRMENTNLEGISTGQKKGSSEYEPYDSSFTRHYTDFFPSAAITFNKHPKNIFNLSYSRRIDRPAYQDLNPFEMKLDEYTFMKGNINLRPQYTNSLTFSHTYKYKLNSSLSYSHVNDMFAQLIDTAEGSKAFLSKRNLATQDVISLNISYPFQRKAFSSFMNVNTNYSHYRANFGEGREIDVNAAAFRFFAQNSLKFKKTWTAELNGFYNAPTVMGGTFKMKGMWSVDAGLQKQVMKGQATIRTSVSDVFNTLKFSGVSEFAGQTTKAHVNFESRQFKMSFVYRFGNNQVKAARQRTTGSEDENKRVGSGGSGSPLGQ